MHSAQSCALFLGARGHVPRKILKIRYFEIESGGTFCKIHIVTFISLDYVIVPTALNAYQTIKTLG